MMSDTDTKETLRLLFAHRSTAEALRLGEAVGRHLDRGAELSVVHSGREALGALALGGRDAIIAEAESLADLGSTAEAAVAQLFAAAGTARIILISPSLSVSHRVAALAAGAHEVLEVPVPLQRLAERIAGTPGVANRTVGKNDIGTPPVLVGPSSQMQVVIAQIARIAPSSSPVFITGERGVGKSLAARSLHGQSGRAMAPFIAPDLAGTPANAHDQLLFGTGQTEGGAIAQAHGGTLFLDEIATLGLDLQGRLLRFLQSGRLGASEDNRPVPVDVRVIVATSQNPLQMVAEKRFREDLFYRLHVLALHLPPLRQRPTDIVPLARHFAAEAVREGIASSSRLSAEAETRLEAEDWPGNASQLRAVVRAGLLLRDGEAVGPHAIAAALARTATVSEGGPTAPLPPILPLWQQEKRIIEDALSRFGGNIGKAAAALEISPSTIYRKKQAWDAQDGSDAA